MKLESKELRIGNWIHLSSLTDGTEVDLQCGLFHLGELNSVKYNYKPIPLTEEILLKCGFECVIMEGYPVYFHTMCSIEYYSTYSVFHFGTSEIRVKHLHQLQNLYFALTGEELTINL